MRPVSDAFLLNMAEVSATLIGLFLVGVFFYVETGFRRLDEARDVLVPYFRVGTRIVLILYALPLLLSLTLVSLGLNWNRVLFALLSLMLLAANIDSIVHVRAVAKVNGSTALVVNEVVGTAAVLTLVVLPWALGGLHPSREDLTWAILLSFGSGFLSVGALVMSVYDTASDETAHPSPPQGVNEQAPVVGTGEIEIAADPQVVWDVLTAFEDWPSWNPEVKSMSIQGAVTRGTTFRWKAGPGTITSTIERVEPPQLIAWTGKTLGISAIHFYWLEPRDGKTFVRTKESYEGLVASLLRAPLKNTLNRALADGLQSLKAEAEGRSRLD